MHSVTLPHIQRLRRPKVVTALSDQPMQADVPVIWTACVLFIAAFWIGVLMLAKALLP